MSNTAGSIIFFGIFVNPGSEHFHRLESMYKEGSLPDNSENEESAPKVGVSYVYDELFFCVGIELYRGDWDAPIELSVEKLQSVNTAVNVEALRQLCEKLHIPFTEPKLLLTTNFW